MSKSIRLLFLLVCSGFAVGAVAADEPDLIFRRSTVFKWLTPNDKLVTYGLDDPGVEGVACHFTVPERGGVKGWLGVAEEVRDREELQRVRALDLEPWAGELRDRFVRIRTEGMSGRRVNPDG